MFWTVTQSLISGLGTATQLFALTLLFGLPLGLVIAFGSMSKWRPLKAVVDVIVWIIRGTPGRMTAGVIAFVINYSCYFSVIYRGGIQGVPVGQREAAEVLGFTKSQIFFKVTLLQMIKRIVPPMSNEIITLVKDTSLARIIAITELTKAGESYMKSAGIIWPLFYTGLFYLVFVGILTIVFNLIERKLSYFR